MGSSAEVVRAYFRSFESGDVNAVARFWHPEIEWRAVAGAADDVGVIRGQAELRRYYEDWIDALDELKGVVDEILGEEGERVAVSVRNSGRGKASGVPVTGRYYVACVVRDGQIVAGREYSTAAEAIEAEF